MTDRYRISDTGVLMTSDDVGEPFIKVECLDEQKYCNVDCVYFERNDKSATLKCLEPETVLELED